MQAFLIGLLFSALAGAFALGWHFPDGACATPAEGTVVYKKVRAPLPDFSTYTDVNEKKQAFFDYLLPMVHYANQEISKERTWLLRLQQKPSINQREMNRLLKLADKYEVSTLAPNEVLTRLLEHVDIVPVSLALAQAANESAWGTSRFAVEGNNLFGQWCYEKGCGLVPLNQVDGQHYEVAKFKSVQDSVISYMRNLNSHYSYDDFRKMRSQLRDEEQLITGLTLAEGLLSYSTRRHHYVDEIQAMILHNDLGQHLKNEY